MKDNRPNQPKQTTSPKPRCSLHATGIHAGYKDGEDILAGLVLLIGWGIWVYIYGNMAAVGTGSYRIGTFLLGAGSVLNLFVVAISFLDVQRKVK